MRFPLDVVSARKASLVYVSSAINAKGRGLACCCLNPRCVVAQRGQFSKSYLMPMRFDAESCDRDFGASCPEKWVSIGAIFGDGKQQCSASFEYEGPCGSDVYAFESVSSLGRLRWSSMCRVSPPSIAARQPVVNAKPMRVMMVCFSRFRGRARVPTIHFRW